MQTPALEPGASDRLPSDPPVWDVSHSVAREERALSARVLTTLQALHWPGNESLNMSTTGNEYEDTLDLPPLVQKAVQTARRLRFGKSCIPAVGRLLHVLANGCPPDGHIGETGTGVGVGASWLASGMPASACLTTVEHDTVLAEAAADVFIEQPNVRVLHADWRALTQEGPFDLLFVEIGKRDEPQLAVEMLAPGGIAVLDDFTPESHWPPEWRVPGWRDEVREWWLGHPQLVSTEILTTPSTAAILAVRKR